MRLMHTCGAAFLVLGIAGVLYGAFLENATKGILMSCAGLLLVVCGVVCYTAADY